MAYKEKLIKKVEMFYTDVIDEFKEAEMQIMVDSRFRRLFNKKDYKGHIEKLRNCKKTALAIDTRNLEYPSKDKITAKLVSSLERTIHVFINLCDEYIQLQILLDKKAQKEKIKYSEYKEGYNKISDYRKELNNNLHDLDILYTDYSFDENTSPYKYLD